MCLDPVSAIVIGSAVVGTAGSLYSASQQAAAARDNATLQSAQYQQQAALQRRQADLERITAGYQQRRLEDKAATLRGQQRNAFASAGVLIDDGSPADVIIDSGDEAAADRAAIGYNADIKAGNLRTQAGISDFNAKSATAAGEIAANGAWTTGIVSAANSALSGLEKFGTKTKLGKSLFS